MKEKGTTFVVRLPLVHRTASRELGIGYRDSKSEEEIKNGNL